MRERRNYDIFGKLIMITDIKPVQDSVYTGFYDSRQVYVISDAAPNEGFKGKTAAILVRGNTDIPIVFPTELYGKSACYECNIVHILGSLIEGSDKLFYKFEKTSGAVMFTLLNDEIRYLIIKNESGHIGFPKGHVEYGETELETAEREIREETGLKFVQFGDFRDEYTFFTRENCIKTGAFYISYYDNRDPEIQHEEILDDWLLDFDEALKTVNFPEDKDLLKKADKYIRENIGRVKK